MEPVGLGVKPQDAFVPIKNVLDIAGSAQNLARGGMQQQTEQMILQERQKVQQYLSQPQNYMNDKGEIDFGKLAPSLLQIAPTTGAQYIQHVVTAQKEGTEARRAINNATEEERKIVGTLANSLVNQPGELVINKLNAYGEQNKNLKPAIDTLLKYSVGPNASNPQALNNALMAFGRGVQPVSEQQGALTGQFQVTGGQAQQVSPTAKAAGMGPDSMPITMAPGNLESIETAADGSKHIVSRSPQGTILSTRPLSGGAPQGGGGGRTNPLNFPPGDREAIPALTAERQTINNAAKAAQGSRFNNAEIIKLADEAHTGKSAETLQKLGGGYALIPWTSDSSTNMNRLGHFIALEAVQNAQTMGIGGTDAGRSLAQQATVDTQWTRDAIKSAVKVNDALAHGMIKYNEGMERAIQAAGGDILAAREFKNKWTQAFDLNVYRLANAVEKKDTATINDILGKEGTPQRKARALEYFQKNQRLQQLVTQGQ